MPYPVTEHQRGTQHALLLQFEARLRDKVEDFNEQNCVVSDEEIPPVMPYSQLFCTVTPTDGTFDESAFAGAGASTLFEHTAIVVSVLSRVELDRVEAPRVSAC